MDNDSGAPTTINDKHNKKDIMIFSYHTKVTTDQVYGILDKIVKDSHVTV